MSSVSTWVLPPEPDVPAVRDAKGLVWTRRSGIVNGRHIVAWSRDTWSLSWPALLSTHGPLTAAVDDSSDWTLAQCDRIADCERCGRTTPVRRTPTTGAHECRACWDRDVLSPESRS